MVRLLLRLSTARQLPGGLVIALVCAAMAVAGGTEPATLIVTTPADSGPGSLRSAIAAASDGDMIQFAAALNGRTIGLTSDELVIDKNIAIRGPGSSQLTVQRSTADGTPAFRILHITPGHTVMIEGLKIRAGSSHEDGGGVLNDQATLTLDHCAVEENYSGGSGGGGIYNFGVGAVLTVLNSTVNYNLNNGHYYGNGGDGGGINSNGTLTITNSIVSRNSVTEYDPFSGRGEESSAPGPWKSATAR